MEISGHLQASAALPPSKEPPVPIGQQASFSPVLVWMLWNREKALAPAGNLTQEDQSVARYTY
jgi:hypothetical protein